MTERIPHTAMVLAAGYGKRMLPLTATLPKPLLPVGGRTMLDQVLDRLRDDGINKVVVNAGYLGAQIAAHCAQRQDVTIVVSPEPEPLETGGGVKQALPLLGDDPIFVINADLPWQEDGAPALQRLRAAWEPQRMDMLLLVMPLSTAHGFGAQGDFALQPDGRLARAGISEKPMVYIGAMIVKLGLYAAVPETIFSNNRLFDQAEAAGRLYGCLHQGNCYHVGTPADWERANALLQTGRGWTLS